MTLEINSKQRAYLRSLCNTLPSVMPSLPMYRMAGRVLHMERRYARCLLLNSMVFFLSPCHYDKMAVARVVFLSS